MEFTSEQIRRQDDVENAVFNLCKVLTDKHDLEWDMSFIGEIADSACSILTKNGFRDRYSEILLDKNGDDERVVDCYGETD